MDPELHLSDGKRNPIELEVVEVTSFLSSLTVSGIERRSGAMSPEPLASFSIAGSFKRWRSLCTTARWVSKMELRGKLLAFAVTASLVLACLPADAGVWTDEACKMKEPPYSGEPPKDCETLWATWAWVEVPGLGGGRVAGVPDPKCATSVDPVSYGKYAIQALKSAGTVDPNKLKKVAANLTDSLAKDIHRGVMRELDKLNGDVAAAFRRGLQEKTGTGNCQVVAVWLPSDAKVVGYRLHSYDTTYSRNRCSPGTVCGNGWSKFKIPPTRVAEDGYQVYTAMFINWHSKLQRTAQVVLFYEMPSGEVPLKEM